MRTQNEENTSNPLTNLVSTLNNFERQQIDNAFADMDSLFKDWLLFEDADDQKRRQNYLFSLQVIQQLGKLVKAIPTKTPHPFVAQMEKNRKKAQQ